MPLRGILAIILGLFAFFKPACMLIGIVQAMGLFFLLDGVLLRCCAHSMYDLNIAREA